MRRRGHDDGELRRVYREHVDAVYAFFAYSVSRQWAEDLTASTFERVIRNWRRYDPAKASERTWILAIARNLLTDHFRREGLRQSVSTDEHPGLLEVAVEDEALERRLSQDELTGWLSSLGDRERQVLALRYGADMTAAEVAAVLDLTTDNIHQIGSRALRRLRQVASDASRSG